MSKPVTHETETECALLYSDAWHRAVDQGHDMELGWHDTERASWVAQCWACLQYLALDFRSDEGRECYGGVAGVLCPGAPPSVPPATRRSPFDEAAVSALALEPLGGDPVLGNDWIANWHDPESPQYLRKRVTRKKVTA